MRTEDAINDACTVVNGAVDAEDIGVCVDGLRYSTVMVITQQREISESNIDLNAERAMMIMYQQ